MRIEVFKTLDELIPAVADFFVIASAEAIAARGVFNVALSGGSSPEKLYELLASSHYEGKIDWDKVNFFFGDERHVPLNHAASNGGMVKRTLFDPLNIPGERIFFVDTTLTPQQSANKYFLDVSSHFGGGEIRFDLVLLGLGDDAHTASLFPHTPVLKDKSVSIKSVYLAEKGVYRITMTAPMINQARHIVFLVFGESKGKAVYNVLQGEKDTEEYPAQLIEPGAGDLRWFLDEAAAAELK